MDFYSLIKPVTLSEDPIEAEDGALYYNDVNLTYRMMVDGSWTDVVNYSNLKILVAPETFIVGSPTTASFDFLLNQGYSENILYVFSASYCNIVVPDVASDPSIHAGSRVTIVRAGEGNVNIVAGSENVEIETPSNVYLTSKWDAIILNKIFTNTWLIEGEFRDLY
jgi:hypothetical protein